MTDWKRTGSGGDLVPVHGGLAEPVDRVVPLAERSRLLARGREAAAAARDARRPLDACTGSPTARSRRSRVRWTGRPGTGCSTSSASWCRGAPYAWTIPLSLPATDAEAAQLSRGGSAALQDEDGEWSAILDEIEMFDWDKPKYALRVYRTERLDHPGGRLISGDPRSRLVGGRLRALPQAVNPEYGEYMLSPRMMRALIRDRKWERALAFQTRNPLHRAHEYALVAGAERLTREGYFTGVVLNPLVGELKGDDVPALTRMRCYRELHDRAPARRGRQGRGAVEGARLRPDRGLRADRPRHQDVLRRARRRR